MNRLLFALSLFLAGCATLSTEPAQLTPAQGKELFSASVSTAAFLIIRNNESYLPAVQAATAAVQAFILDGTNDEITQEQIDKFVAKLARQAGAKDEDIPLFLGLSDRFQPLFKNTFKVDIIRRQDPRVTEWVQAFADGISDALSQIERAKRATS